MMGGVAEFEPFIKVGTTTKLKLGDDTLKLLAANGIALALGSATEEGGNLDIYRDAAGNKQVAIDADAASNEKALDVYGGVIAQNYLTVGQTTLNSAYPFVVTGSSLLSGNVLITGNLIPYNGIKVYDGFGISSILDNISSSIWNINISGVDATVHEIKTQIDSNTIFGVRATGDGVGGIEGQQTTQYGGQRHARTAVGAADYNPSAITSDYIISMTDTAAVRAVTISTEDRDSGTPANPRVFIIKDESGTAGTNNITISLETAGNIDGVATKVISTNYDSVTLYVDGTNAFTI